MFLGDGVGGGELVTSPGYSVGLKKVALTDVLIERQATLANVLKLAITADQKDVKEGVIWEQDIRRIIILFYGNARAILLYWPKFNYQRTKLTAPHGT